MNFSSGLWLWEPDRVSLNAMQCWLQHKCKSMIQEMPEICIAHPMNMCKHLTKGSVGLNPYIALHHQDPSVKKMRRSEHICFLSEITNLLALTLPIYTASEKCWQATIEKGFSIAKSSSLSHVPCQNALNGAHTHSIFPHRTGCHKMGDNFAKKCQDLGKYSDWFVFILKYQI